MLPDQSGVYDPEELSLLGQTLDQAVQSLPLSMRTPQNCTAIARNIWPVQPPVNETQSNLGWRR
jgi:hypothetical protein